MINKLGININVDEALGKYVFQIFVFSIILGNYDFTKLIKFNFSLN